MNCTTNHLLQQCVDDNSVCIFDNSPIQEKDDLARVLVCLRTYSTSRRCVWYWGKWRTVTERKWCIGRHCCVSIGEQAWRLPLWMWKLLLRFKDFQVLRTRTAICHSDMTGDFANSSHDIRNYGQLAYWLEFCKTVGLPPTILRLYTLGVTLGFSLGSRDPLG